jgi:preprotein translocase subunit SecG
MKEEEINIVKVKREKLSSEQVHKKENFAGILNKHSIITKRPVYRQKKFYFFFFLLLTITLLIYYSEKEEKQQETNGIEKTN